jgi:hypothetical protein
LRLLDNKASSRNIHQVDENSEELWRKVSSSNGDVGINRVHERVK